MTGQGYTSAEDIPAALQGRAWDALTARKGKPTSAVTLAEDARITVGAAMALLRYWHRAGYVDISRINGPATTEYRAKDFVTRTERFLASHASSKPVSEHETRREEHAPPAR